MRARERRMTLASGDVAVVAGANTDVSMPLPPGWHSGNIENVTISVENVTGGGADNIITSWYYSGSTPGRGTSGQITVRARDIGAAGGTVRIYATVERSVVR